MHQSPSPVCGQARLLRSHRVQQGSEGGVRNRLLRNEWDLTALSVCRRGEPQQCTALLRGLRGTSKQICSETASSSLSNYPQHDSQALAGKWQNLPRLGWVCSVNVLKEQRGGKCLGPGSHLLDKCGPGTKEGYLFLCL